MPKTSLTPDNIEFIKANKLKLSGTAMAEAIGVSKSVVNVYMRKNGLSAPKELVVKWRAEAMVKPFSEDEDRYIMETLASSSLKKIAADLRRTSAYVGQRAKELGLSDIITKNALESRIKAGNVPSNKGKKQNEYMSAEAIERTKGTRFQKGQVPHNAYGNDGIIKVRRNHKNRDERPYKWIRVALGKWEMLHVHNWIKENGPIPEGNIIVFKNRDTMNCDLSNLEMITRAEHAVRNSNLDNPSDNRIAFYMATKSRKTDHDFQKELLKHPELIELKRHQLKLQKAIKNAESTQINTALPQ